MNVQTFDVESDVVYTSSCVCVCIHADNNANKNDEPEDDEKCYPQYEKDTASSDEPSSI